MEGKKIKWQGSPGMSRYGDAGPPIQYSDNIITVDELKALIKENDIKPDKLFTKEEIAADPKVRARIEALIEIEEENSMIPDDNGKPGDDDDLIPDCLLPLLNVII